MIQPWSLLQINAPAVERNKLKKRYVYLEKGWYMSLNSRLSMASALLAIIALQACKHPLAIVGEGDIVDANNSGHGCTLEQFQAQDTACTENEVSVDYYVNYKAEPRPGWRFVRWEGPCSPRSDFQHCSLNISEAAVAKWDEMYPDEEIPPSTAVFAPITGNSGFLVAGAPVVGVTYETPTQEGVTGLDGSFQYEVGETVRFIIGATVLGKVIGNNQVTLFDLAGSPVQTGIHITWALQDEKDPYHTVINLAVLLHSLDDDGDPDDGIVIRPGVASLLDGIALNLRKPWASGEAGLPAFEEPFQPWLTFQTDPTFRHVLGRAKRRHRFSIPHGIAEPPAALASVYDNLGIDPKVVGLSLLELSQPGEPTIFETLYYDENGNITRHENTGFGDSYELWQYNDQGKVTRYELHASAYGRSDVETWQYDAIGNLRRFERSDYIDIREYLYDDDSNPTQETWTVQKRGNTNVKNFFYEYDKRGLLQQFTSTADGGFNVWKFNSRGNVVHHEQYDGYSTETWFYNSDGNVTRHESTLPWSPEIWQYSVDGKLLRYEQQNTWCDRGCYRMATTREYDEIGRLVIRSTGNLVDNTMWEVDTWQYDETGRVISRKGDPLGGDEIITETWRYHTNGQIKRHVIEGGYDDLDDQYDSNGNLIREVIFDQNSIEAWRYDTDGDLMYRSWDANSDGVLDEVIAYEYTATGWAHLFSGIKVYGQSYRYPIKPAPNHEERPPE